MRLPEPIKSDLKAVGYPRLFGSRSMASRPVKENFDPAAVIGSQITDNTDWDFSQQYSEEADHYLQSAGFTVHRAEHIAPYADDLTEAVYIKGYIGSDGLLSTHCVNIVLHNDETLFRQVWDSIDAEFYYMHLWKRSPYYAGIDDMCEIKMSIKTVMNQLYTTARSML